MLEGKPASLASCLDYADVQEQFRSVLNVRFAVAYRYARSEGNTVCLLINRTRKITLMRPKLCFLMSATRLRVLLRYALRLIANCYMLIFS